MTRLALVTAVLVLAQGSLAQQRRGSESARRDRAPVDGERRPARGLEGESDERRLARERVERRKNTTGRINLSFRGCNLGPSGPLQKRLKRMRSKKPRTFTLEIWSNATLYRVGDPFRVSLRSNRDAHVYVFSVGPGPSDVIMLYDGIPVEGRRDFTLSRALVIVEPVGREQLVGIATREPYPPPCYGGPAALRRWLKGLKKRAYAVGHWQHRTDGDKRRRRRLRR